MLGDAVKKRCIGASPVEHNTSGGSLWLEVLLRLVGLLAILDKPANVSPIGLVTSWLHFAPSQSALVLYTIPSFVVQFA